MNGLDGLGWGIPDRNGGICKSCYICSQHLLHKAGLAPPHNWAFGSSDEQGDISLGHGQSSGLLYDPWRI